MAYKRVGFKGYLLYGISEAVSKHGREPETSELYLQPVAYFDKLKDAEQYVETVKLAQPRKASSGKRIAYSESSVLAGCFSHIIDKCPDIGPLPINPESKKQRAKTKAEDPRPKKRRARKTTKKDEQQVAKPKRKRGRPRKQQTRE